MQKLTTTSLRETHTVETSNEATAKPAPERSVDPATDKQIAFLRKLIAERTPDVDEDFIEATIAAGKRRVSEAIDNLLAKPPVARSETEVVEPRRNRYPGRCEKCVMPVPAEEGLLVKDEYGNWAVEHEGECPSPDDSNVFPFPFGRYAVETDEGHLAFYQANAWGLFVMASDETHPVAKNARQTIIDKIAADPEGASIRYGLEIKACGVCGRTLTAGESRDRGIGPECAKKHGWG